MAKGTTVSEAAHKWVNGFNAIPRGMIEQLMRNHPDDWTELTIMDEEQENYYTDLLPMWGTMWSFGDACDDYWLEKLNGIEIMSKCGFRIYEHDEFGYFFGIDGAGYDFYTEHWIPLYKKRGLQWHDPTTEYMSSKIAKILKRFIEDKEIVEKLVKLKANQTVKIGGYYGGFLSSTQIQKLTETGLFEAKHKHEKVQEMHGEEANNYYVVRRI